MKFSTVFAVLLAAAMGLGTAAAAQGLDASPPAEIAAAAETCLSAITPDGLDGRRLASQGWIDRNAGRSDALSQTGLQFFMRDSVGLLAPPNFHGCIVTARVADEAVFRTVVTILTETMGAPVLGRAGAALWTLTDGKTVAAAPAGSPDRPGVRIEIRVSASQP